MATAAGTLANIKTVQKALAVIQALSLTAHQYPPICTPSDLSSWDFIVIGAGDGGSVVASRLSEDSNTSVLLIEAGGYPPLETALPAEFSYLPRSLYDWNFTSLSDNYTTQNLQGSSVSLTQGKMLGGSGSLSHVTYVHPTAADLLEWAEITGDDSWNYTNMKRYLLKMEELYDEVILNSSYASNYGTTGYIKVARQPSTSNADIMEAFKELGHKIVVDLDPYHPFGYLEPLLIIADGERQSNALVYLGPAKKRSNLCLALETTAIKIIFDSNNVATGVEIVNSAGETLDVYANKEIIVSAGAINSPLLLMRSGIGPKSQLTKLGIDVLADLPVGENLQDHIMAPLLIQMKSNNDSTPATNPHEFPHPFFAGYVAMNTSKKNPDCQTLNILYPHDSTDILQFCSNVMRLNNDICDKLYKASNEREILLVLINLLKPKSRGKVLLTSTDYKVAPDIYTGTFSDSSDLALLGECLEDYIKVLDTTYFQSINASLLDFGICPSAETYEEFSECYSSVTVTNGHYSSTCSMGEVLDSQLRVKEMNNLRVVDSSSMPTIPSGHITASITALAEFASELIREAWNIA